MATSMSKRELRARARARRHASDPAELGRRSRSICERVRVLRVFDQARAVALYWPMLERHEVDVRGLDAAARSAQKRVYYPYLRRTGDQLGRGFRRVDDVNDLRRREWPFAEPDPDAPEARADELDLMVVPALAADARGHRIGYGSAFYDAVIAAMCPPACSLVVVYDFELVDRVPVGRFDRACDLVVTDLRMIDRER